MVAPYVSDIIGEIAAEVDNTFSTRTTDPFNVFFDYGLYVDVAKNIYKKENGAVNPGTFPLIWLVDRWSIRRGDFGGYFGEVSIDMILAMPTDSSLTSAQRAANTYLPRLLPIYDELIKRIYKSSHFAIQSPNKIPHTVEKMPYWGGQENGQNQTNMFKNYIDALYITSMRLISKNNLC